MSIIRRIYRQGRERPFLLVAHRLRWEIFTQMLAKPLGHFSLTVYANDAYWK